MPNPTLDVVCLCAAWCGTCRDYEATFEALQVALPGHRYAWIDVETFPTLMVAAQGRVLFAGPVLPRLSDAQRLLQVQAERVVRGDVLLSGSLPVDQAQAFEVLAQHRHSEADQA